MTEAIHDVDMKITERIRKLLERATHEGTSDAEAEACKLKAEMLMAKHRIDMAMLAFEHKDQAREILVHKIERHRLEYAGVLNSLKMFIYRHCKCQVHNGWEELTAVGYESDLMYADLIWSGVYLDFVGKMLPTWSAERSFDQNVYLLKESGKSWMEIVYAAPAEAGLNRNSGSRLRTAYANWARKIGAEVKAQPRSPKVWRQGFVEGFDVHLRSRLMAMADQAKAENSTSEKAAVALQTDEDRVNQFFWTMFPELHPDALRKRREEWKAQREAKEAAKTPEEREKERKAAEREQARFRKMYYNQRYNPDSGTGYSAGIDAAKNVDLGGTKLKDERKRLQ